MKMKIPVAGTRCEIYRFDDPNKKCVLMIRIRHMRIHCYCSTLLSHEARLSRRLAGNFLDELRSPLSEHYPNHYNIKKDPRIISFLFPYQFLSSGPAGACTKFVGMIPVFRIRFWAFPFRDIKC